MKKLYFLFSGMLLCICCALQAKSKVIERPPFTVSNTTSIEVGRIEISDTATVLHIFARYQPKFWIKIASGSYLQDNNGETYPLRSGIGITPDAEFWMPESGEAEFKLVFPPLPDSAASIDFTEGAGIENGFSIWGIQLKNRQLPKLALPEEAIVHKVDKKSPLPDPVIAYGKATLKGRLLDFRPGMCKEARLILRENIKGDVSDVSVPVRTDGSFSQEVTLTGTTSGILVIPGAASAQLFMEPGETTEVYVNLRESSRLRSKYHSDKKPYGEVAYINGPLAVVAQELNRHKSNSNLENIVYDNLKALAGIGPDAYKTKVQEMSAQAQAAIDKLPCSLATRQLLTLGNRMSLLKLLQSAAGTLTSAAMQTKQITREKAREYYDEQAQKIPAGYTADADLALLNNPQALLTDDYSNLMLTNYRKSKALAKAWGTDKGLFFDIARMLPIYQAIKNFTPMTEAQVSEAGTLPSAYREMLTNANDELLAKIEANKKKTGFRINEAGEVANEDLFASIISKFSGKVILVDFWATWCGPCRMANKAMIPMKEELKDKDIVYLYITGETSPLKTWENMIPDIHGEHYRVTAGQWDYLGKAFNVSGVPTYLIVDREGNVKYRQVGFPGAEAMKKELLKVCE